MDLSPSTAPRSILHAVTQPGTGPASERLTQWEAVSLMVGAGVGAGIMAVPYLAERVGYSALVVILLLAYGASALIHLMLAEVLFRTGRDLQIVELIRLYVFRGPRTAWLLWLTFALLTVAFVANLAAYVSGEGEIVTQLTGLTPRLAELAAYVFSAGVVFFGLKVVGVFERFAALGMVLLVAVLAVGAVGVPFQPNLALGGGWREELALFGTVLYGYYTFFTVPQVVKGLGADRQAAVRAITIGLGVNGALMAAVALIALGVSVEVTKLAITGISDRLGSWSGVVGQLFIFGAFITSYWSVSLALADILRERIRIDRRLAWLAATIPSIAILYLGFGGFLEWLRLAAGATAIVVVLMTIPMYVNARRHGEIRNPEWTLGRLGHPVLLGAVLLSAVLMAVGSFIEI